MMTGPVEMDIDELPQRMTKLEDGAFVDFAEVFGRRFRAYFLQRGLSLQDAEDLAVSCVTDAALKVNQFQAGAGSNFEAWVFTLARHAFVDWLRDRQPIAARLLESDLRAPEGRDTAESETPGVVKAVQEALRQLPELDQRIIALRHWEYECPYAEIGRRLNLTEGAARVRHHRALERLQRILAVDPAIQSRLLRSMPPQGRS